MVNYRPPFAGTGKNASLSKWGFEDPRSAPAAPKSADSGEAQDGS